MSSAQLGARQPPRNVEAEVAVLGAVLLDNTVLDQILDSLHADDFYREAHRVIYQTIVELAQQNVGLDTLTLYTALKDRGLLDTAGGPERLAELVESVPTTVNALHYARIVRERAVLRRFIAVSSELVEEVYGGVAEVTDFMDRAEAAILGVADTRGRNEPTAIREVLHTAFEQLEQRMRQRSEVTGVPTGFVDLDRITAGMQRSDLLILAARPSMGKTALCLNLALNAALMGGAGVGIFSLEMSKEQLVTRMLSSHARVSSSQIRTGRLRQEEFDSLFGASEELSKLPIYVDDTPALNIMELRSKCRRLNAEGHLDLIIVDYLQLMRGPAKAQSREQEISEISRSLKGLAKELNVPVLALSQLNRALEGRADKRPMLADLRESGAIEQDADIVMFIYRDEVYNKDTKDLGVAEVIVAKQRNGSLGKVRLAFLGEHTRFDNLAEDAGPANWAGAS